MLYTGIRIFKIPDDTAAEQALKFYQLWGTLVFPASAQMAIYKSSLSLHRRRSRRLL